MIEDPHFSSCAEVQKTPEYPQNQGNEPEKLCFHQEDWEKIIKILQNFNRKKATPKGDMQVGKTKEKNSLSQLLPQMLNFYININTFPTGIKKADFKPVYRKDDPFVVCAIKFMII